MIATTVIRGTKREHSEGTIKSVSSLSLSLYRCNVCTVDQQGINVAIIAQP